MEKSRRSSGFDGKYCGDCTYKNSEHGYCAFIEGIQNYMVLEPIEDIPRKYRRIAECIRKFGLSSKKNKKIFRIKTLQISVEFFSYLLSFSFTLRIEVAMEVVDGVEKHRRIAECINKHGLSGRKKQKFED